MPKFLFFMSYFCMLAASAEVSNADVDIGIVTEPVTELAAIVDNLSNSTSSLSNIDEQTMVLNTELTDVVPRLQQLAKHQQWHHLLFYKKGKAQVISDDFYLSAAYKGVNNEFSPYEELVATLKQAENLAMVCRYPARYLWLSQQLTDININLSVCEDLPNPSQKISLILISDYLKNPASSFGHVLVKTNDKVATPVTDIDHPLSSTDLLNNAYNFGARIPQDENGLLYALKGLFGFYDAGFVESEFFKQDAVYSKNEQRDMWEYALDLNEFDTQLLNYHLYEAKSARFSYFFIKQNCGYRSGEILELISDIKTTQRLGPWYAPDYLFNQLVEFDSTSAKPLVSKVRYLPSEQTQLRYKFVQLSPSIQQTINEVIRTEALTALATLSEPDRALVLDFLILHRTYKLSQDDTPHNRDFKKTLLSQRFMLPQGDRLTRLKVPNKPSPALSNKTALTQFSISNHKASIGLSMFVKDPLNSHTDLNKQFEAVQAIVTYDFDDNDVAIEDFVFLHMQQIEDLAQPLAGEPKLSWELKTGARTDPFNGSEHSPYLQGGIGAGAMLGDNLLGYAMLNTAVHDQDNHFDMGMEFGVRAKSNNQAAQLSVSYYNRDDRPDIVQTELTLRQKLSKNDDARLVVQHVNNAQLKDSMGVDVGVAWHHYW